MLRAIETSILLAHRLGVEYEISTALREIDMGILEGRSDDGVWQIWKTYFEGWTNGERLEESIEGGETFRDVEKRFLPFIEGLVSHFGATDERILCLAHGGLYWMMLPLVVKNLDKTAFITRGGFKYTDCLVCDLRPEGLVYREWIV